MTRVEARVERVRLHKFLADAGTASRRHAEELVLAGRVLVNDAVVDALPAFVDPERDVVVVDGTRVRPQRLQYFLLHKPKGVVCTNRDPAGRPRAVDLLPPQAGRLFPVGRLDTDTSGLLLMTNDGELAERVSHPRYGLPKVYRAEVSGRVPNDLPARMRAGVYLSDGKATASDVKIVHADRDRSALMITLREGRNRQVRRMLVRLGHPVCRLTRVQIGPLSLKSLPNGAARPLTPKELDALRRAVAPACRGAGRSARRAKAVDARSRERRRKGKDTVDAAAPAGERRAPGRARPGGRRSPPPTTPGRRVIT